MSREAGKGDDRRPGAPEAYQTGHDRIDWSAHRPLASDIDGTPAPLGYMDGKPLRQVLASEVVGDPVPPHELETWLTTEPLP